MVITMQIQKVFQAGNSQVVAIPKELARELGLKVGYKVVMEKSDDGQSLVVHRADSGPKKLSKKASDAEFQQWLDAALREDGEILDELARR